MVVIILGDIVLVIVPVPTEVVTEDLTLVEDSYQLQS